MLILTTLQEQGERDAESPLPVQLELAKARAELAEVRLLDCLCAMQVVRTAAVCAG
jgi:hypothetical protein